MANPPCYRLSMFPRWPRLLPNHFFIYGFILIFFFIVLCFAKSKNKNTSLRDVYLNSNYNYIYLKFRENLCSNKKNTSLKYMVIWLNYYYYMQMYFVKMICLSTPWGNSKTIKTNTFFSGIAKRILVFIISLNFYQSQKYLMQILIERRCLLLCKYAVHLSKTRVCRHLSLISI